METNMISSSFRKKVGTVQQVVEQRLEPENDNTIKKILCVNAKSYIDSMEILNGEANFGATVVFDVMYLNENNEPMMMSEKAQVSGKIEDNTLNSMMQPLYKVEVVDTSIENASSTDVKVNATIEVCLDAIVSEEVEPFVPTDENVLVKKELKKFLTVQDAGKATITIQDDFDLKQDVSKVLLKSTKLCVKEITSGTGYFTVEGTVYAKFLAEIVDAENRSYKEFEETVPFKEEVDAEKITKDAVIKAVCNIKYDDVMYEIVGDENSRHTLKLSVPVIVRYVAFVQSEAEMPIDAYCTTHKTNIVSDSYRYGIMETTFERKDVDGTVEIGENDARINKIYACCCENVNLTNSYESDDEVKVEGVLTVNAIYEADDEEGSTQSVQVEVPFSESVKVGTLMKDCKVFVCAEVCSIDLKVKKGKDIDVSAVVEFVVETFSEVADDYIKEVMLTEELSSNPYSLQIYMAKEGATLWEIAKHLYVKEDDIVKQNPNLVFPLEKTESIVYFKQK